MSSTPTSPLSIAIIGVGRIGSAYAYQLARAGRPSGKRLPGVGWCPLGL
jgi:hypothetical protein